MNGDEQRAQGTRTAQLNKQLLDQGLVIEALATELLKDREAVDVRFRNVATRLGDERTWAETALRLGDRARETLAASVGQLQAQPVLVASTLWQRLRWLVRGR